MLLSKETAVKINLVACKFKLFAARRLKQSHINLTPEQFLLLDLLWNDGPLSQQKIANKMGKDKNSITKLVDALERKLFVRRLRDENDRRSNVIVLTEQGEMLKETSKEFGIAMLDSMLKGIEDKELQNFISILDRMTFNMKL